MFSKILVPLDGSQLAEQVLPYAKSLAQQSQAAIMLLRVANHPARQYYIEGLAVTVAQSDDSQTHCEAYLYRISEILTKANITVNFAVREGAIADVILDYADEIHADLIAMSTHGRTGVGRWVLGSVADRIVHGSHVPILLIRGQHNRVDKNVRAERIGIQGGAPISDTAKLDLPPLSPKSVIH